ncbi:hypothetical protein, partial [Bradyrhizobium sp.]|uniref:hypothetical protein n=1 Tax=Bradyrhizobium sp. TaxID=376 RepID=UPI003C1815E3
VRFSAVVLLTRYSLTLGIPPPALRTVARLTLPRPPHLIPRFMTIASRPSWWDETKQLLD